MTEYEILKEKLFVINKKLYVIKDELSGLAMTSNEKEYENLLKQEIELLKRKKDVIHEMDCFLNSL